VQNNRSATLPIILLFAAFVLGVAAAPVAAQSGAWKLRASSPQSGPIPAKGSLLMVFADETGAKIKSEGVDANGTAFGYEIDAKFDGKEYAVKGSPFGDSISLKKTDDNTIVSTWKKDGRLTWVAKSKVSEDGKIRIVNLMRKTPDGNDKSYVLTYDRMDIACGPKFCEKACQGECGNGTNCDCPKK
jgi:hypothetical protein